MISLAATATAAFFFSVPLAQANPHILVDVQSGRVLEHEEAFRKWYPASLTKLMTAYTVFNAIRAGEISLETPIVISKQAAAQPAAKMYYKPGQKLTLDSALKILMIKSANDVAVAVAEAVAGTQDAFVLRMNSDAAKLGMSDSHFVNPNGLPGRGQYTTARDLAVLTVALRRDFPQYAGYFALEGFTNGKTNTPNINLLIGRFAGADGMKTGFICASGFNQIGSATRNGRTIISVVLGTDSLAARADATANLLQKGFTAQFPAVDTLGSLKPYGLGQDQVTDLSADICSAKGAKVRSETRDEVGRMKVQSPYIQEMDHEPRYVFAGLIPGQEVQQDKMAKAEAIGDLANVPVPLPRPTSF
ncbi:serine-type D-Ala-D-Ala carboxypeptidase protein [Rhizobium gallicum]|uniref:Serine-type D-Ala-D-Ala carboxypeptidase protein n=1 Tax=Rhizobium gallicum TaxID=56730 RepID=A0A1L5NNJ4_9HYPH|nr:D-alanyl-D-alanine carboxypeptidase family protein [Rhizobium gallicum]APO69458.1 serine-type D-Ala-D-Ala carboxypeptidase protein [Rhizobium gallicum]